MTEKKLKEVYSTCEDFFKRNYPDATIEDKNLYLKGVIDVISYLNEK
jgi:hypothetical protein